MFHRVTDVEQLATVWQHYLLIEMRTLQYLGLEVWRQQHGIVFGQIIEGFLRAGADPHCWFLSFVRDGTRFIAGHNEDENTSDVAAWHTGIESYLTKENIIRHDLDVRYRFLQLQMGHDRKKSVRSRGWIAWYECRVLPFGPSDEWSLRAWIKTCDIPNKATLLELIDKRLFADDIDRFCTSLAIPGSWEVSEQGEESTPHSTGPESGEMASCMSAGDIGEHLISFVMGTLFTGLVFSFLFL
ncbi:hypothetical protein B0T21DRAFT_141039 [Apiosordaria backusii]|uniref:Uncharacterized protein n=1 Tax=Apiosordaria backusii TaxID=314023 RepID=A0AA40BS58_9PEZI|nr:hypothetical protein B0T21DRAFT_141039 [Apiosordaria backusii]